MHNPTKSTIFTNKRIVKISLLFEKVLYLYRCSGLTPYELKILHSSYKENRSETRFELWEFLFLILNIMENNKNPKCYNCKHASRQFKVGKLTHLHCFNPKYPEQDFIYGKLSAWDTLRVYSDTCKDHEFKTESEVSNG